MRDTWFKWLVVGMLTVVVALATAFMNRDVYSKEQIDSRIIAERAYTNEQFRALTKEINRLTTQVDRLVTHLIERDNGN